MGNQLRDGEKRIALTAEKEHELNKAARGTTQIPPKEGEGSNVGPDPLLNPRMGGSMKPFVAPHLKPSATPGLRTFLQTCMMPFLKTSMMPFLKPPLMSVTNK